MSDVEDSELEEIRRRKLLEAQQRTSEEQRRAQLQEQAEAQKQALLRQILTPEARQRLSNLKMVKPEFAEQVSLQLIQVAQTGRVKLPITDEQLKVILSRLMRPRREISIRRI